MTRLEEIRHKVDYVYLGYGINTILSDVNYLLEVVDELTIKCNNVLDQLKEQQQEE